jgi:opacity protein-like surface antigen
MRKFQLFKNHYSLKSKTIISIKKNQFIMTTTNRILKLTMLISTIALFNSCASFFNSVNAEAGANLSNQSLSENYIGEGDGSGPNSIIGEKETSMKSSTLRSFRDESDAKLQTAIPGFYIGVNATKDLSSKLSAKGGLRFSTKGSKTEFNQFLSHKTRLSYFDTPIELQYRIQPRFYIQGGVLPSFLVGAKRTIELEGSSITDDVKDNFKSFDFAVTLGAGYNINEQFSINFGYDHGLMDVSDIDYRSIKNRAFRLGLQYRIKGW